jgi:hypothetical protein
MAALGVAHALAHLGGWRRLRNYHHGAEMKAGYYQ